MDLTVGLGLYTGQRSPGAPAPDYGAAVALARAAEDAGFDVFWVSEHHGLADDYLPSPLPVLAAAAQATERIRLGTGLALSPLYHPVRLAEDAAVVDILSGGRLILGLGLGYAAHEYAMYGVDRRTRGAVLDETLSVLRRAWQGEPFSHEGPHLQLRDVLVRPRPVQADGIPVWLGGYADAALERTARLADGHLVGRGDPTLVASAAQRLQAAGVRSPRFTFAVNYLTLLTSDDGHPEQALRGFTTQQLMYEAIQRADDAYAGRVDPGGADDRLAQGTPEAYFHLRGGPDEIAAGLLSGLESAAGWPRVHVVLRALFPEGDIGAQAARITALGRTVLPLIRSHSPADP
jgi:probable F420-dependent oxidoreductase